MTNPPSDAERWQLMFEAAQSLIAAPFVAFALILIFAMIVVAWRAR